MLPVMRLSLRQDKRGIYMDYKCIYFDFHTTILKAGTWADLPIIKSQSVMQISHFRYKNSRESILKPNFSCIMPKILAGLHVVQTNVPFLYERYRG